MQNIQANNDHNRMQDFASLEFLHPPVAHTLRDKHTVKQHAIRLFAAKTNEVSFDLFTFISLVPQIVIFGRGIGWKYLMQPQFLYRSSDTHSLLQFYFIDGN